MSEAVKVVRKALTEITGRDFVEIVAESTISILTRRFVKVSKPVKDKIRSITDIDLLDELNDQALFCYSMAEFTKSLK